MTAVPRTRLVALVERTIAPYIGGSLASASTRVHLEKLGLTGDQLGREDVERLLVRLAQGLRVFVGPERTAQLMQSIRSGLD